MMDTALQIALLLVVVAGFLLAWRGRVRLEPVVNRLEALERLQDRQDRSFREEAAEQRAEFARQSAALREELSASVRVMGASLVDAVSRLAELQEGRFNGFSAQLARTRDSMEESSGRLREEVASRLQEVAMSLGASFATLQEMQKTQLEAFALQLARLVESNEKKFEALQALVDNRLQQIQQDSERRLEEIRRTVDEKLQSTLEKRLGESFQMVSRHLESVHRGLGEMQKLAQGVGDLKRVLSNVKTRGTWGEIAAGTLLEQILAPDQYDTNVVTREGSGQRVEFAVRLPGRDDHQEVVWLPIDAKFPKEVYERVIEAADSGQPELLEAVSREFERVVRQSARTISEKYLNPPRTTDFGIMFLASEGLYAEVVRRPGLVEQLQREYRIVVTGPTTLAALLNSLQMGFRTLAIQKRSSEVWNILAQVKTEFGKFGVVLEKVKKKLTQASNTIDEAGRRSRAIQRRLRTVQDLPEAQPAAEPLPEAPAEDVLQEV